MLRGLSDIFESWQSKLRTIIDLLETSDINEIEVSFFGRKIRVSKGLTSGSVQIPVETPNLSNTQGVSESLNADQSSKTQIPTGVEVKSPMVGTFFRSPSPEFPAFVNEGDKVSVGQIICIIEAMKIMNEIESEIAGRITKVQAENGDAIEYGQSLFIIEPD